MVHIIVCQILNSVCHSILVIVRDVSITSKPAYLLHNLPPHISHGYLAFLTCLFQLPFIALMFSMGGAYRQFRYPSSPALRVVKYICLLYQIACKVQFTGMHIYLLQSFLLELPAQRIKLFPFFPQSLSPTCLHQTFASFSPKFMCEVHVLLQLQESQSTLRLLFKMHSSQQGNCRGWLQI